MDAKILNARIEDTLAAAERSGVPRFLGFLNEEERSKATELLLRFDIKFRFFGGYDAAERTMLVCLPEWCDDAEFPIDAITFSYRNCDTLTHRDFLGSVMALGVTRESVGDILVEEGRTVIFVSREVSSFLLTQIEKVGRVGVDLKLGFSQPLPQQSELIHLSDTVASMRLDGVVAALIGTSRNKSAELIENGSVFVNSLICEKTSRTVIKGDSITVRGKGKFFIDSADEFSKKGRTILKYSRYK